MMNGSYSLLFSVFVDYFIIVHRLRKLALLNSFQMLVNEAIQVSEDHAPSGLKDRCPMYAYYEPVVFRFSDLAIHFLQDPNRVSP